MRASPMEHKRVYRNRRLTPSEADRDQQIREKFERERPTLDELLASGDYSAPIAQGSMLSMMELVATFRKTREQLHLSLSDVAARSGIDRAAISRLETGQVENPTFLTLERIATSLGKRIRFVLDEPPASD